MALALNDETLPVLAFSPSVAPVVVVFLDFLFKHPFDLGVALGRDHHEALFRDDNFLDGKGENALGVFVDPVAENEFVGENVPETELVDLGVEVSINA